VQHSARAAYFVVAISSFLISAAAAEQPGPCSTSVPKPLIHELNDKFPGWRLKTVSDLGEDDHRLWLQAHPKQCPGTAAGHFNGTMISYALLLVRESNSVGGYKLVVATPRPSINGYSEGYSFDLLDHSDTEVATGMVISRVKPGKYSDFERTRTVTTQLDCINVEGIEAAAELYYWAGGQYKTLQTSD
jgi:hypothetical protein